MTGHLERFVKKTNSMKWSRRHLNHSPSTMALRAWKGSPAFGHKQKAKNVLSSRLSEKSYFKDWIRQGLISPDYNINYKGQHHSNESFRVSTVNNRYAVAETYPALLLVPSRINDDSLKRYSRHHKHSRFPTITWRHPKTKALLLRGSGKHFVIGD